MANKLETSLNSASSIQEAVEALDTTEKTLANNKVSNFAYTDTAYDNDTANGVTEYDYNNEQNIPVKNREVINVNETVLLKGYRSQASSVTRMFMNHFLGRVSYNLNKTVDVFNGLLTSIKNFLGEPNGIATLDENGKVPLEQLPDSTIVYKGEWDASTNTPHLINGTGTQGDFYEVKVGGWFDAVTGNSSATEVEGYTQYFADDGIIYDGTKWNRRGSGDVKTVNGVAPSQGDVKNVIHITQAEYEELTEEQKKGKFYIVEDDSTDPLSIINDETPSDNSTYSSNKVNELLEGMGTGSVSSVNNKEPDADGNVTLGASDVGALGVSSSVDGEINLESTEGIVLTQTNDSTATIEVFHKGTGNINLITNTGSINLKGDSYIGTEDDRKDLIVYGDIRVGGTDTDDFPKSIRFGDGNNVKISETDDDYLEIYSSNGLTLKSGDVINLDGTEVRAKNNGDTGYSKVVTKAMFSFDASTGTLTINM